MTERRWLALALALGSVAAVAVVWFFVFRSSPLEVTIHNATGGPVGGLSLATDSGLRTSVPDVAAGASVTSIPQLGGGEDSLSLVDGEGREYLVLDYFEGDPGGSATITITGASGRGLSGRVLDERAAFPGGESALTMIAQ
jgi:hypothetical protein